MRELSTFSPTRYLSIPTQSVDTKVATKVDSTSSIDRLSPGPQDAKTAYLHRKGHPSTREKGLHGHKLSKMPVKVMYNRLCGIYHTLKFPPSDATDTAPRLTYKEKSIEHRRARELIDAIVQTLRKHSTATCPFVRVEDGSIWEGAPWAIRLLGSRKNELNLRPDPEAAHLLLRRISRASPTSVPGPDLELCYNAMLAVCGVTKDGRLAREVYGELRGEGERASTEPASALRTLNAAASAMANGKMWEEARDTLRDAGELDSYGRVTMMKVARGMRDVEEGRRVLEGWKDERSKFLGWSILVDIIKEQGEEWADVEEILSSALELASKEKGGKNGAGNKPSDLSMSYAGVLSPSILAAAKFGAWDVVRETVEDIEKGQYRLTSVYAHAIRGVKEGVEGGAFEVEEGMELVGRVFNRVLQLYEEGVMDKRRRFEMETAFYWVATFAADVVGAGKEKGVELEREERVKIAKWLLGWMEKVLENQSIIQGGKRPTMSAYTQVMATMGRAGEGAKAWDMFLYEAEADKEEIRRHASAGFRANNDGWAVTNSVGWNVVLKGCLFDEAGPAWSRAEEIFEAMASHTMRNDCTWFHVLEVAAAAGEVEEAMRYLERMIREERKNAEKIGPNKGHFRVVLSAIKGGIERLKGGDERFRAEEYTNMVVKVVSQGIGVLRLESYYDLMGAAMGTLSSLGREGDGVRVLMDVVRNAEQGGRLNCTLDEALVRIVRGCRMAERGVKESVEAAMEMGEEMGLDKTMELYRAATASVAEGESGDSSGWAMGVFDDAVDRGLHKGGEVVGLNGSLDLHGCNVPLAIGGVHWIAEKAGKEGWNELVIVTGNERAEGEGIRNNVIKELDEAGCEGFYTVDKNQNGKNKGRINVMGKSSIEKVSKSLMRKRSES